MAILDVFRILFETDAGKATAEIEGLGKKAEGAAEAVDGVARAWEDAFGHAGEGVKGASDALKQASEGTRGLKNGLIDADRAASGLQQRVLSFAGGLVGALVGGISVAAIQGMATGAATRIEALAKEAKQLRVSAPDLDAFRAGLNAIGVEAETSTAVLSKMGDTIQEATTDKASKSAANLNALGIKLKSSTGEIKTSLEVMLNLSDKMAGKTETAAGKIAARFGITDQAQIDLLRRGRAAIVAAMDAEKERGVVTQRQIEIQKDYKRETDAWSRVMEVAANKTMELVLPAMTRWIAALRQTVNWMRENQTLVTGFFIAVAGVITRIYLPALLRAAAATLAALAPYLAMAAAAAAIGAAFALAYEDVQAFMSGQPSLLGELVKQYTWVADAVKFIGDAFKGLAGDSDAAMSKLRGDGASTASFLAREWAKFGKDVKAAFDDIEAAYLWLQEKLKAGGWDAVAQSIIDAFEKAGLAMQAAFDDAINNMIASVQRLAAAITKWVTFGVIAPSWGQSAPAGTGTPTPGVQVPTGGGAPATVAPPVPTGGMGQKLGEAPPGLLEGKRQVAAARTPSALSTNSPGKMASLEIKQDQRKIDVKGGPITINAGMSTAEVQSAIEGANRRMIATAVAAFDDGVKS